MTSVFGIWVIAVADGGHGLVNPIRAVQLRYSPLTNRTHRRPCGRSRKACHQALGMDGHRHESLFQVDSHVPRPFILHASVESIAEYLRGTDG